MTTADSIASNEEFIWSIENGDLETISKHIDSVRFSSSIYSKILYILTNNTTILRTLNESMSW